MGRGAVVLALSAVMATPVAARDLGEILRDKGVLSEKEAAEADAAGGEEPSAKPATPAVPAWLGKITPFGDIRVRWEGFRRDGDRDRDRFRMRLRLGARAAVTDEVEVGFRLASGNADDPISTNQSFTDTFTPKNVSINTAYLKLAPARSLSLERRLVTLYGGKFEAPLYRPTETVLDSDLTPEGFHEVLSVLEGKSGSLALQGGQWSAEEVAAGSDAWIFVGQAIGRIAAAPGIGVQLGIADYAFREPDLLAVERNDNTSLTITNDVRLSDGTVVGGRKVDPAKAGPNGDGLDADGQPIRIVGFEEDFNVLNVSGQVDLDTGIPRLPLSVLGDYALNTEADREDTAFTIGASVGGSKRPGEVSAAYLYSRKETNSVVSSLTFSDFGFDGGTNVKGHVVTLAAGVLESLTAMGTLYVTEAIEEGAGVNGETAYRFQIDLLAKF